MRTSRINHMKKLLLIAVGCGSAATAQIGRTLDWVSFGGDAQRTGWEKSDARFTKDQVSKDFRFLWKVKPPGEPGHTLMPPVVVGTLVGYRGFKELAFFAGYDDTMPLLDAALDRTY